MQVAAIALYLKRAGNEVTQCSNPIDAQTIISNFKFDCIVVDYLMPEMNGIELVKWLRSHSNKIISETPVLLLTGWQEMEIVREAYFAGINLFRTKTDLLNNPSEIINAVDSTINLNSVHRLHNKLAVAFKRNVDNERYN